MEQSFNHVLEKINGYGPTLISSTSFVSYGMDFVGLVTLCAFLREAEPSTMKTGTFHEPLNLVSP